MIGKLSGIAEIIADDKCIIDNNGVGYIAYISGKTADFIRKLPKEEKISLIIETVVKQDAIELYGFSSQIEKSWFSELTKVQGVGARMAQKVLGSYEVKEICQALLSKDIKFFTNVSGIGPKVATRIVNELKDSPKKIGGDFDIENLMEQNIANQNLDSKVVDDAISALENLGYKKHQSIKIVQNLLNQNPKSTIENLITNSLRELSKKTL